MAIKSRIGLLVRVWAIIIHIVTRRICIPSIWLEDIPLCKAKIKPYIEARAGIMYNPYWIEKVQKYSALSVGIKAYKGFQVGLRGSIFSRPSRYFTANAAVVIGYAFGK